VPVNGRGVLREIEHGRKQTGRGADVPGRVEGGDDLAGAIEGVGPGEACESRRAGAYVEGVYGAIGSSSASCPFSKSCITSVEPKVFVTEAMC
jgi:hypothetical protein